MVESNFIPLKSERLTLRRLRDSDLEPYLAYLNDPLVAKYQTWESYPRQRAIEVIEEQKILSPGIPGAPFLFAVELTENADLVGHVVITVQEKDHAQAEIGFTFARLYHGRGLAREAAACVLNYAFSELKFHRIFAITDCENLKSVALLSRLNMRREGHYIKNIWYKGKWGDEYSYAILREEWLKRGDAPGE